MNKLLVLLLLAIPIAYSKPLVGLLELIADGLGLDNDYYPEYYGGYGYGYPGYIQPNYGGFEGPYSPYGYPGGYYG
ncbi:cuticle protein 6.4-like [Chironomus tepperi]|uniref:cuticle protein 6.4-like n=1 Tax=Chironomus tepperi TaxID=113505 RepID=UPI00391F7B0D